MSLAMTLLWSTFHVTGAAGRASGYGAPETPPLPYWPVSALPLEVATEDCAPLPHAARIAEAVGRAVPAAAGRWRNARRLYTGRSFGCNGRVIEPPRRSDCAFVHRAGRARKPWGGPRSSLDCSTWPQ